MSVERIFSNLMKLPEAASMGKVTMEPRVMSLWNQSLGLNQHMVLQIVMSIVLFMLQLFFALRR